MLIFHITRLTFIFLLNMHWIYHNQEITNPWLYVERANMGGKIDNWDQRFQHFCVNHYFKHTACQIYRWRALSAFVSYLYKSLQLPWHLTGVNHASPTAIVWCQQWVCAQGDPLPSSSSSRWEMRSGGIDVGMEGLWRRKKNKKKLKKNPTTYHNS